MQANKLWPVHLKPKPDELLSSWLCRLTMAHGQKLHSFCSIVWPGKAIWNRDIDKSTDETIVNVLSEKTSTPLESVRKTLLASFEGILYESHSLYGPLPWILPVGVYHRTRLQFGLQYCSQCLAEDTEPYFRCKWRLAFIVVCERHKIELSDRCPECRASVNFHRNELGNFKKLAPDSMVHCYRCGFDLRKVKARSRQPPPVSSAEVEYTLRLLTMLTHVSANINQSLTVYPLLYFAGLRQVMAVLAMRHERIERLRHAISTKRGVENYSCDGATQSLDLQERNVRERRQLLGLTRCIMEDWPNNFIALAQEHSVWSSVWLRHLDTGSRNRSQSAPFWFWRVVRQHLYRKHYCPSDEEIRSATTYLRNRNLVVNDSALSRLLGGVVRGRRHGRCLS